MRLWRVLIEVKDAGGDSETGERFRHLTKGQVEKLFDKLDLPAGVTADVRSVETDPAF